jgi:hypothetical protein
MSWRASADRRGGAFASSTAHHANRVDVEPECPWRVRRPLGFRVPKRVRSRAESSRERPNLAVTETAFPTAHDCASHAPE